MARPAISAMLQGDKLHVPFEPRGFIGIVDSIGVIWGSYRDYIGVMEKNMETTTMGLGCLGFTSRLMGRIDYL